MTAAPPGWRLRVEESLPSTSDLLLRLAAAGEPERLAVLAHRQTAGRGRSGRGWDSRAGNLHLSVLLRPAAPAREIPQWALLAAVALAEALGRWLPGPSAPRLKWPNDLLLGEAKLAGVLCEASTGLDGRIEWLVIGMGANLATAPAVEGRATACIADVAPPPPVEPVAVEVMTALDRWRGIAEAEGFAPVRKAWMARGPLTGTRLTLRGRPQEVSGRYLGLAEDGSLLLDTGAGPEKFNTGETAMGGD